MNEIEIGWTEQAYEQHLADKAKARRRRNCEVVHRNVDRWSKKSKTRDNRAAAKAAVRKEVYAR
jgi:hypothetical protein